MKEKQELRNILDRIDRKGYPAYLSLIHIQMCIRDSYVYCRDHGGSCQIMSRKIAFFDIDGTLTSEIDGSVPADAASAIRQARNNGHLMFINTGRCMQNVEERFREVGFDGYCCGCGTNIYCTKDNTLQEILYVQQNHSIVAEILDEARNCLLYTSRCV